jgi:hypothetical protein
VNAAIVSLVCSTLPLCFADDNPSRAEYVYVEDPKAWVVMQRGGLRYWGHLDAAGNFLPDRNRTPYPVDGPLISGAPLARFANFPRGGQEEQVYEFRSGRLIKGTLNKQGDFVPDAHAKVTSFGDYYYHSKAIRIYNLPGKFVAKEHLKTINEKGRGIIRLIKDGTTMDRVDEVLGEKSPHARDKEGRITHYYYTAFDIIVEFDHEGLVIKALNADLSRK